MEHFDKKKGITSRQCSLCGGDLGDRYIKQRYCLSCHAKYMREHRPKHRDLPEEARKKANARAYLKEYIKRSKIKKEPCIKCGETKVEGHHSDYNKPLDVVWLCRKHHLELHETDKLSIFNQGSRHF